MATGTGTQQQTKVNPHVVEETSVDFSRVAPFEDMESLLRYLYTDLTRIHQVASTDIILHPANRSLVPSTEPIRGIEAVQAHEEGLVAATKGTLEMEVGSITANSDFGAVLGMLRARARTAQDQVQDIAMQFCGVWRFVDGKAVEHWENAANPARFRDWLAGTAGVEDNA